MRGNKVMVLGATVASIAALTGGVAAAGSHGNATTWEPASTHLTGTAGGTLSLPGMEGDRVSFTVNAHGVPGDSRGRFDVDHTRPDGAPFGAFNGAVDCVVSDGDLTIVTGVIEEADLPGLPGADIVGKRVGFTVRDVPGDSDRFGWSWMFGGLEADTLRCAGTVPFFPVEHGDFESHRS